MALAGFGAFDSLLALCVLAVARNFSTQRREESEWKITFRSAGAETGSRPAAESSGVPVSRAGRYEMDGCQIILNAPFLCLLAPIRVRSCSVRSPWPVRRGQPMGFWLLYTQGNGAEGIHCHLCSVCSG